MREKAKGRRSEKVKKRKSEKDRLEIAHMLFHF
jgi:hypothetical protein